MGSKFTIVAGVLVAVLGGGVPAREAAFAPAAGRPGGIQDGARAVDRVPYDGRFVFARLRYGSDGLHSIRWRVPPWAHDYPDAEANLMRIVEAITCLRPYVGERGGNIFDLDDPELFRFPVAYMAEPGYWTMTPEQATSLRRYLLKGGFLIVDDFRGPHWDNFARQMERVLPEHQLIEIDGAHPVFRSFFEIPDPLAFVPPYGHDLQPRFFGIFEENDPRARLMVIANYNNDIGDYWEHSASSFLPIDRSNDAYKFGVNYLIYGLTH